MHWLKHAFGIEKAEDLNPTEEQLQTIDHFCEIVTRKKLIVPVSLFLETVRPLNYVGSQILYGLSPIVSVWIKPQAMNELAQFLENRGAIDFLCKRLEESEQKQNFPEEIPDEMKDQQSSAETKITSGQN